MKKNQLTQSHSQTPLEEGLGTRLQLTLTITHLVIFADNIRDGNHDCNSGNRYHSSEDECTNGELNEIEGAVNPSAYCWTSFTECTG